MIESIFNSILFVVFKIVQIVLYPIDMLISSALPEVNNALSSLAQFFVYVGTYIHWIFDALMIGPFALSLLIAYYVFKLTMPINVWIFKLALSWYRAIKG